MTFSLKTTLLTLTFIVFGGAIFAQSNQKEILTIPENWRYERIDFPLGFAPDINYQGFEELRFAPGMFDTLSSTYFTYVFALSIEGHVDFSKSEIEQFLSKYFKGLCDAVASSKELSIDTSKIKVDLKRKRLDSYLAQVNFFDAFTNGKEVILNLEIETTTNRGFQKSFVLALVSPQDKQTEIWEKLYGIRENIKAKNPGIFLKTKN